MTVKQVAVTTLTFRDGPQSTGMWDDYFRLFRNALMEWKSGTEGKAMQKLRRIANLVKEAGFSGAEVFWGQSFQKYMLANINPFEAMTLSRVIFGNDFMLSGLGRGINAVGFRPYGQDVIDTFVERFAERGGVSGQKRIKMRVFDALNNIQNCATMIAAAIRHNRKAQAVKLNNDVPEDRRRDGWREMEPVKEIHVEAALCYQPEREYNNETLYSDEYYVEYARKLIDAAAEAGGALDSLVIKDMAGQLDPVRTAQLLPKLVKLGLPVYLHTHCTNYPQAVASMRVAAEHGIAGVETVEWPLAGGTAHASVRDVIAGMENAFTTIDNNKLLQLEHELESLFGKKEDLLSQEGDPQAKRLDLRIDESSRLDLWALGIPGGAMAAVMNLLQNEVCTHKKITLKEATSLFAAELEHLQSRIGWVPLVTPMADIVYTQAIFNVINGRNRIIEHRYAKMVVGLYGAHVNHATGKQVSIDASTRDAVLEYCEGVLSRDVKTPCFGMSYPIPRVVAEQKVPALEMEDARKALAKLLERAEIDSGSHEADEAAIMRLMEPPGSKAATERILLQSIQERIKTLIGALTIDRTDSEQYPTVAVQRALEAYGGVKRAETFSRHLIQADGTPTEVLNHVAKETTALLRITNERFDIDDVKNAITRLTRAVLENKFLNNHSAVRAVGEKLPFGPENGIYFLQCATDPYSPEARTVLQEHWPGEYQAKHLYNAVRRGLPFDGEMITDDAA